MSRGKSVTKLLLDSSQAALIINAWELVLKAYVYKYIGKKRIYEKDKKHTISFSKALTLVRNHINAIEKNKKFAAIYDNLFLLNEYRCSNVHFIESKLDPVIFMLISKAVLNYNEFIRKYFKKDITRDDNLIILPIGLKLPFDSVDY